MRHQDDQWGSKNASYKDGLSRSSVNRRTYAILFTAGRDLYKCERCGHIGKQRLPRHHKDRDRSNNTLNNLEVLCVTCHNKEHMHERERNSNGQWV